MAGEVFDGDLDVGEGGVEGGVVQQPTELEGKVSAGRHTRCVNSVTKPKNWMDRKLIVIL